MKIALITGASSGLGREYIRQMSDPRGPYADKFDAFYLVARRTERLKAIQQWCPKPCRLFPIDLSDPENLAPLKAALVREKPKIRYLINAAGLGKMGACTDIASADNDQVINVNVRALVDVTTLCLPYLSRGSHVLQVASTASFQPMPNLAVYGASKAFVRSYSEALNTELKDRGVHVTAVCPYWIKDTEFIHNAEKSGQKESPGVRVITKKHIPYQGTPFAVRCGDVVTQSLLDSTFNAWVSTPGLVCSLHRAVCKLLPDRVTVPLMNWISKF